MYRVRRQINRLCFPKANEWTGMFFLAYLVPFNIELGLFFENHLAYD